MLASPLHLDVVDRLNATVKFRESFRPFAPVVLSSSAADYFTLAQSAPYMSFVSHVTELTRDKIPAVVHANGTARVQTVTAQAIPFLAEVLGEFAAIAGVPALIDTSLNVKGKPMCGTPGYGIGLLGRQRPGRLDDGRLVGHEMRIGYSFWASSAAEFSTPPTAGAATGVC